jgi:hypothetical protein
MSRDLKTHLTEERLCASVVDEGLLTGEERGHLETCPVCASERRRLASGLSELSRQAARLTPGGPRRVDLPAVAHAHPMARLMGWSMGLALASAVVLIAGALLLARLTSSPVSAPDATALEDAVQDAVLVTEVMALEDDPLPEPYNQLVPGAGRTLDDDFFDFLIPLDAPGGKGKKT